MFPEQVTVGTPRYEESRKYIIGDINAVVEALRDAGVDDITVCDTHYAGYGGGQVDLSRMINGAQYESPTHERMMPSLDKSYDGLILLAHHAMAGTLHAFLDHTISSGSIFSYCINGKQTGEMAIEAAWAGYYGVPVIMTSGDDKTAAESKKFFKNAPCAVVKKGLSRSRARCLAVEDAHALLRKSVKKAVHNIDKCMPYKPALPLDVKITYTRSDYADASHAQRGGTRKDSRTLVRKLKSPLELPKI